MYIPSFCLSSGQCVFACATRSSFSPCGFLPFVHIVQVKIHEIKVSEGTSYLLLCNFQRK